MKTSEIRSTFLQFFKEKGHEIVPSSSLVPSNDPTLLFTNAGMVQFKEVFLGTETRSYARAASSQRCVRAGGKHNDLENVGYTARHHTFFEMLGNFSFGDYFKREAIQFAWELLTQVFKLPAEKLWVTVYSEDDEAADIWLNELKVDPKRFSRCGEKDNFWQMGDMGPCGPCSEVFYDHGPEIAGGPPGSPDEDGDRYVEVWNLVFMQYNRSADGKLSPLPKPSVDTGMGLERIAAVLQGVHNNYDIDLFQNIIKAVSKISSVNDLANKSLRVIADHIRSAAFLIIDGVIPSNEGRGYVLRRIIRRAIRHGNKIGLVDEPFFYRLVAPLANEMGKAYPELHQSQIMIEQVLEQEEEQFAKTLSQGLKILEQDIANMQGKEIAGEVVFKLYDTYGFPADLTADIARERDLTIDAEGFEKHMQQQRQQSKQASKFSAAYTGQLKIEGRTEFTGYQGLTGEGKVSAIFLDKQSINKLDKINENAAIVLDRTPFYAESGGQVGDKGLLHFANAEFVVHDTQKQGEAIIHHGQLKKGTISLGDAAKAEVDPARLATIANHSATHLLHAALREILGKHVVQKGSLVESSRLRFDFSHFEPISIDQLQQIEHLVNEKIRANIKAVLKVVSYDEAVSAGAMALFGEKYADKVRVLSFGDFSVELCGGTHVERTGDIGLFKITSETGIAAGIRRIEAVTSQGALDWVSHQEQQLLDAAQLLKTDKVNLLSRLKQNLEQQKSLEKDLEKLKGKLASHSGGNLVEKAKIINGIKVISEKIDDVDIQTLRDTMDQLKNKLGSAVIVLATVANERVQLVAGVTTDNISSMKAGELVNFVAQQVGGKGGGRPDMAQAGGTQPQNLSNALESVSAWVADKC